MINKTNFTEKKFNEKKIYLDGQLIEGKKIFEVINPATEKPIGSIAWADSTQAKVALKAAEKAFNHWSSTSISERTEWMKKLREAVIDHEEHLRECIHLEMGKNWEGTKEDFDSLVNSLQFYGEEISRIRPEILVDRDSTHSHRLVHEPAGVVVAFLAWNFPLLNLAFKLGPAMAAGCPIIIKPSFKSPLSAYAVGELCAQIGLPPGVVNIICGKDNQVGDTLSSSTIPSMLTLIGSVQTGRHIMSQGATSIKRYSMELGGNAPVLVFADADLDLAAEIITAVKFGNAGQICVAPNRVFVEKTVAEPLSQKIVERAQAIKIGFDRHGKIDMGPLIDRPAWQRVDRLVKEAVEKGASLLTGGQRPNDDQTGHFYAPTVLEKVTSKMDIYHQEIFGPVVSLIDFERSTEVIKEANDTEAGLTAYVFSKDLNTIESCSRQLRFGEIQINGIKYAIDLPHGGMKQSGIGFDCSHLALQDYLVTKRISRPISQEGIS